MSGGPSEGRATHILLVDDDQVDVLNVKRAFERGEVRDQLWTACDGVEALAILRGHDMPAERRLVLLDVNMPRMNGIEFLRELRADPVLQTTPVVMLTTSNDDRDRIEAFRLNVAGYLLKPVSLGSFVDLMTTLHRYWTLVEMP